MKTFAVLFMFTALAGWYKTKTKSHLRPKINIRTPLKALE